MVLKPTGAVAFWNPTIGVLTVVCAWVKQAFPTNATKEATRNRADFEILFKKGPF